MNKRKPIFKILDEQVFALVDKYKASNIYAQFSEQLNNFSDVQQKVIGQVFNLLVLIFPLIIVTVLYFGNRSKQSFLEVKKDIIKTADRVSYNKSQLKSWGDKIVSSVRLNSEGDLQNRLNNSVKVSTNEDKPEVFITSFIQDPLGDSFMKTSAFIEFSNLSSKLLSQMLREVVGKAKSKVISINIQKDPNNNFIRGNMELVHYGKK